MPHRMYGPYERYFKRPLDCFFAVCALVVLSPTLLIIAILVRIKLGAPVLFRQERPGKDEKIFTLFKFRTMTDCRDADGELLPDAERLTRFGAVLRSTSLDELPELLNIVRGEMAFVGPRPLLVQYLARYNTRQARRHEVRPGITGLAQIHGRNAISWEEKLEWDAEYVDHVTFLGDLRIVLVTVKTVFKKEGISAPGDATMPEFMGSEKED